MLPLVLLVTAALVASPVPVSAASLDLGRVDLDGATIPDLRRLMDRGRLTSVQLAKAYLGRIKAVDSRIRSVVAVNHHALAEAAASDARRHGGRELGPLDGIPVLLKDNVDTRAMPTTAGAHALRSFSGLAKGTGGRLAVAWCAVLGHLRVGFGGARRRGVIRRSAARR
ncbi:amidase family protein [Kibdelosporangium persicum]|uniref:Amidase domain-containing protein n=1 Tax=Kibdelosporangium persicum TaxID=2698649 RepID=A0ABX2FC07_9PSEU|nr:amidase family protein [Kibdelosporangium persicum]NRN68906.1 hypothetical protein [Kibdelosporangium persicum]